MTTLPTRVFTPLTPTGPADDVLRERQIAEHSASGGSSFGDVLFETMAFTPTTTLVRKAFEMGYQADPAFVLDQKLLDQLTEGVDQDLWDKYADAVSEPHALYIEQTNRMMMEKRRIVAEGTGFSSFAAQMLGSLSDPGSIAVGLLTGGAGFAARVGVVGNAAIAGGSNMILTGLQASEDPSITGMDVLRAGAGGAGFGATQQLTKGMGLGARVAAGAAGQAFPAAAVDLFDDRPGNAKLLEFGTNLAFGGLFNAIPSAKATDAQIKMAETSHRVGTRMMDQAQGKPVDYPSSIPAIEAVLGLDPNRPTPAPDLTTYTATETTLPTKTLGAATELDTAQPGLDNPADPFDLDLSELATMRNTVAKASFSAKANVGGHDIGLLRWDMAGMVGGSDIPDFRAAARATGLDWVPDSSGAPVTYSASEWVIDRTKTALADAYLPTDRAYAAHREAAKSAGTPLMSKDDFNVAIGNALRRGEQHTDPNVAAAAANFRKQFDALHERAVRHGVEIGYTPDYVPRRYNPQAIDARIMELGAKLAPDRDAATQGAIGKEALTGVLERAIAKKTAAKRETVTIAGKTSMGWTTEGPEIIRSRAESILDKGGRSTTEDITSSRMELDETHRESIALPDGNTYDIGVEDLLENDARVLFASYSHQLHGKMAISRLAQVFGTQMDGSKEVVEGIGGILASLETTARDSGIPEAQWRGDLTKIERMLKITAGMPLYQTTGLTRTLDAFRKVGSIRGMSNVGSSINNTVELIQASAELGAEYVAKRVVPGLAEIHALIKNGEASSTMARDLERMGLGIDRVASRILPRLGDDLSQPIGKTALEMKLSQGERLAFDVSLQSFTTDAARLTVGMAFQDRWAALAHAGQGFSEKRLALQGLTELDGSAIAEQIRTHAVWVDKPGGTLDHMGFENWDPHLRRKFNEATSRTARRLVLENNATGYAQWMTTPVGKMLAQFRTFAFGAHSAKFLTEMKARDATTAYIIAATSVGAAALYTARTLFDASVQSDRKKFLEDRLSTKKVMLAAYSRASYSAMFPTFIDTLVSDMGRQDPWFSYARTTGLRGGGIIGNPTVDLLKETGFNPLDFDPLKVPRAIAAPLIPGYRFSQQDWRAIKAGLAIPDILNLRKLADQYAKELPAESQ